MSQKTAKQDGFTSKLVAIAALVLALVNTAFAQSTTPQIELWLKASQKDFATSIAFNPQNQMCLLCMDGAIRQVSPATKDQSIFATTSLNIHSGGAGYICRGIACDKNGNLHLTDGTNIYYIDAQKKISRLMTGFQDAIDLKFDESGNLYVAEAQECAVYRITPDLKKTRIISRGFKVRMREMLTSIAFDRQFQNLYLAERYTGQILRYPIDSFGTVGNPEIMAREIVSLRSIVLDDANTLYASIDYPLILKIEGKKRPKQIVIPNTFDFMMGRMAFGQTPGDRQNLYLPTTEGIVKLCNLGGSPK